MFLDRITKWQRKCWVWHATQSYGEAMKSSSKLPKSAAWVTPSARRMLAHFSVSPRSLSLIHISAAQDPRAQAVVTAADVWSAVVTTPRTHFQKIIYILRRRMARKSFQNRK